MTATALMFCTINLFIYFAWGVSCEKKKMISAGFTGIGIILLSFGLKHARLIAVCSKKGWCFLEEEKGFDRAFPLIEALIGNLCLPLSCCFWVFSISFLPNQFSHVNFFFFCLIYSVLHTIFSQREDKKLIPLKSHFKACFYFFNFSTKASLQAVEQKLAVSLIFPFFHSNLQGRSVHAGLFAGWQQEGNGSCH